MEDGNALLRFWSDMLARTDGPMSFRFLLQPTMATLAAAVDGLKDARSGRPPYLWKIAHTPSRELRLQYWREGVTAVARILLLGVVMDAIYQIKVFGGFRYPLETFVIAVALAFVPYVLLRGPAGRLASLWLARRESRKTGPSR